MPQAEEDRNGRVVAAIAALNLAGINRGALRVAATTAAAECEELARTLEDRRAAWATLSEQARAAEEAYEAAADGLEEFGVDRDAAERIVSHIMVELTGSGVEMVVPAAGATDTRARPRKVRGRKAEADAAATATAGDATPARAGNGSIPEGTGGTAAHEGADAAATASELAVPTVGPAEVPLAAAEGPTLDGAANVPRDEDGASGQGTLLPVVADPVAVPAPASSVETLVVHEAGAARFDWPEARVASSDVAGDRHEGDDAYPAPNDVHGSTGGDEIWDDATEGANGSSPVSASAHEGTAPNGQATAGAALDGDGPLDPAAGTEREPLLDLGTPSAPRADEAPGPTPLTPRRPPRPGSVAVSPTGGSSQSGDVGLAPPRRPEPVVPDFMRT